MNISALIIVNAKAKGDNDLSRSFLKAGGITLLERQLRQIKQLGIETVRLVTRSHADLLEKTRFKNAPKTVEVISPKDIAASPWIADEKVLVLEEGVLIDQRIMKAVLGSSTKSKRCVAVFPANTVIYGKGLGLKLKGGGQEVLFASAAAVLGTDVLAAANYIDFGREPLKAILKEAIGKGKAVLKDISKMPTYLPDRRREVKVMWRPVAEKSETDKATRALISTAQKGVLDWPARWVHPPFENFLVEQLCPTPVSPNFITLVTFVLGMWITYLFATGDMLLGVAGALVIGVLDGVDGKLARTKMMQTRIGEFEHILDKIVEYSWYFGIAWYLSGVEGNALPWALSIIIVAFAWAEVAQGEFFRRLTGKQLDDAGDFERKFRIIGARRNTQIWMFIPFALMDAWLWGFGFVAFYAAVTFFVAQVRFFIRVRDYGSEKSLEIKKNFEDTAYF
ncbi:MAG: CDP-alcohol phosphatidyltransferase family protein [Proteobacteria bacterium]|nr:CDP-alcohol phosphatidyltransferase family protein [Pseudomonadota bacterium]